MLARMKQTGVPENALNVMTALYDCNRCKVSFRGEVYNGFRTESGVRQGCPISPQIFCICADLLLEKIKHALPTAIVRAYADDAAVVVQELDTDLPVLQRVFAEYSHMSGLTLNVKKTVIIPLSNRSLQETTGRVEKNCKEWAGAAIATEGTYLGFQIGPSSAGKSWDKPLEKFEKATKKWCNLKAGLQIATLAYNTFCLPILTYVAQLQQSTKGVIATEARCLKTMMARGPTHWCKTSDITHTY